MGLEQGKPLISEGIRVKIEGRNYIYLKNKWWDITGLTTENLYAISSKEKVVTPAADPVAIPQRSEGKKRATNAKNPFIPKTYFPMQVGNKWVYQLVKKEKIKTKIIRQTQIK